MAGKDEGQISKEMRVLTHLQRRFVEAWLTIGARNHKGEPSYTECARIAGYSANSEQALRVQGYRLAHDERIQAAIVEETRRRIKSYGAISAEIIIEIAQDQTAKHADRLKAAQLLMDRAGLHAVSESKQTIEHIGNDPDRVQRVMLLAKNLGIDPAALLGNRVAGALPAPIEQPMPMQPAIDVPFEEVEDDELTRALRNLI